MYEGGGVYSRIPKKWGKIGSQGVESPPRNEAPGEECGGISMLF